LQVHPEPLRQAEIPGESQSRIRADRALALDDFVNPAGRNADFFGEPVLADARWFEKFFQIKSLIRIIPGQINGEANAHELSGERFAQMLTVRREKADA